MAKNTGWVKLFRKLIDNRMYFEEPFDKTHAWIDLILIADKNGSLSLTVKQLAERWKWSPNKVRRYIDALVREEMLQINGTFVGTKGGTILTIVKYKDYQVGRQNDGTIDGINDGTNQWGKGDLYNIYITRREEDNNPHILTDIAPKGEKKTEKKITQFKPPSVEEVREYCLSRSNNVDPEAFVDFYTSKGWFVGKNKMKDWKSAVRTWERNNKGNAALKEETMEERIERWRREGLWDHG